MKNLMIRLAILVALLSALVLIGTVGFMSLENLPLFQAIYFTVVTISTVGYGDIHPSTTAGQLLALFLIVTGVGIFLGVIANATELLTQGREERTRKQRINTLVGLFFSEMGTRLLRLSATCDPNLGEIRSQSFVQQTWSDRDLAQLGQLLKRHNYSIDPNRMRLEELRQFLAENGDLLSRLLENPSLHEHEAFTDLLRAVFHLRDELILRDDLSKLPETDVAHLASDLNRAYSFLANEWTDYISQLKASYPYLYSLALRTNPFQEALSPIVR